MRLLQTVPSLLPLCLLAALSGCSTNVARVAVPAAGHSVSGNVHGGQQGIAGATIQLYTVGTNGDGSAATPKLVDTVTTDANGGFTLSGHYSCAGTTLVYLTATGGNPGGATANPNIALMTAWGPCGNEVTNEGLFVQINEVTTVAAVAALAPYMTSMTQIGSGSGDVAALTAAFTLANAFANAATGLSPGADVPTGTSVPVDEIDTLANILATCVNSAGGAAGQDNSCGRLFSMTTPASGTAPTDTVLALLNLANNPALNTQALYLLAPAQAPFQPSLSAAPADFHVTLLPLTGSLSLALTPTVPTFPGTAVGFTSPAQTVAITNDGSGTVTLGSIGIAGLNAGDFAETNTCGATLAVSATCTVQVTATPTGTGLRTASLVVASNAANSPQSVALSLVAGMPSAGPVTLTGGSTFTIRNTWSDATLTNSGTTPLTIRGVSLSDPSGFTLGANHCGTTLAAGASCILSVISTNGGYDQTTGNPLTYSTDLTVDDDAASGPQMTTFTSANVLQVNGTTDYGAHPLSTVNSGVLQFYQPDGQPTNSLVLPTVTASGGNSTDFSIVSATGSGGGSCGSFSNQCIAYATAFVPTASGMRTENFYLTTGGHTGYFPVHGIGYTSGPIQVTPAPGTQPIVAYLGLLQVAQGSGGFTITDTSASAQALTYSITGPNASEFSLDPRYPCATLASSASCTLGVNYSGTTVGTRTATLTVLDTISSASVSVPLSAIVDYENPSNGFVPIIFGPQTVGTISTAMPFQVQGLDGLPLGHPIMVTLQSGSNFVLPAGGSCPANTQDYCHLSIEFAPLSPGNIAETVTMTDLTTGKTGTFAVSGTGVTGP